MSKYKTRKTQIYTHITNLNGSDVTTLDQEQLEVMRVLIMGGYLAYDEDVDGMRIVATDIGLEVLGRE